MEKTGHLQVDKGPTADDGLTWTQREDIRRISIPRRETVGAMKPLTWTAFALAARAATARYIDENKNQLAMNTSELRCARLMPGQRIASHRMRGWGEDDDGGDVDKKPSKGRGFFASAGMMIDGREQQDRNSQRPGTVG